MTRVLVCGGRSYGVLRIERMLIHMELDCRSPTVVIHGGASGADSAAGRWAELFGIPTEVYRAEWWKYGPRAGPIRNARMIAESRPDVVLAFRGGRGTADCVRRARAAGIEVIEIGKDER